MPYNSSFQFNTSWVNSQIKNVVAGALNSSAPRLEAHLRTDRPVYRPNDVVFVEALVLNAFDKTPYVYNASTSNSTSNNDY